MRESQHVTEGAVEHSGRSTKPTIFISASWDMEDLAKALATVVRQVNEEIHGEYEPYYYVDDERNRIWSAHRTWQQDIPRPSDNNVVVTINLFSERIGSALPDYFPLPPEVASVMGPAWLSQDGAPVPEGRVPLTGTLFEFFDALQSSRAQASRQPGDDRPERDVWPYFCGDPAKLRNDGLPYDHRNWGFGRIQRDRQLKSDDQPYHDQTQWLALFYDWLRQKQIPAYHFGSREDALAHAPRWADVIADVRSKLRGHLNPKRSSLTRLKALESYSVAEAAGFFGRSEWVRTLLARLGDAAEDTDRGAAWLITGPSGVGKSSALHAGLLGALVQDRWRGMWREGPPRSLHPCLWSLRDLSPAEEGDPVSALARRIAESLPDGGSGGGEELAALLRGLPPDEQAMWLGIRLRVMLERNDPAGTAHPRHLLLVIDQFEEIVERCDAAGALPPAWRGFVALLLHAIDSGLVWFIGTLSDDRKTRFDQALGSDAGRFQTHDLTNPDKANLRLIIERSLRLVGLKADAALSDRLADEADRLANRDTPVLPLLSMHLTRLVQIHKDRGLGPTRIAQLRGEDGKESASLLRFADYRDQCDIGETIAALGEEAWQGAERDSPTPDQSLRFSKLLHGLVGLQLVGDDYEAALRDIPSGSRTVADVKALVTQLDRRRLLVKTRSGVRLSHLAVLTQWRRVADWFATARDLKVSEAGLQAKAVRWRRAAPAERPAWRLTGEQDLSVAMSLLLAQGDGAPDVIRGFLTDSLLGDPTLRLTVADDLAISPLAYAAREGDAGLVEDLLKAGANIEIGSERGSTPLLFAAGEGRTEVVGLLIAKGAKPDAVNGDGNTALLFACAAGHLDVVRLLLGQGDRVDVNRACEGGATALHAAAFGNHLNVVKALIDEGADPDARNDRQWTPLHAAAENGRAATLRLLIVLKADKDARDENQWTPLHIAAWNGHTEAVRLLIDLEADKEARDENQWTPLHRAAWNGHTEAVRALIELGADKEARQVNQCTPLHLAAENGHTEAVRLLIDLEADKEARDENQWTPLHRAAWNGHTEAVRALIELGADKEARQVNQCTPLYLAAENGHTEAVRALVELKADKEARQVNQWTPLHRAAWNGHTEAVRALVERGADKEALTNRRATPLHLAAENGRTDTVRVLVEFEADRDARQDNQYRPLHWAVKNGHVDVLRALVELGADKEARSSRDFTPLHLAVTENKIEAARGLLELKANPEARQDHGRTPLHLAVQLGNLPMVLMLIDGGAAKNAGDQGQLTPLHLAAMNDRVEIAVALIEAGADKEAHDTHHWTALHWCAHNGHLALLKALIDRGAETPPPRYGYDTALAIAIKAHFTAGTEALIVHKNLKKTWNNHEKTAIRTLLQHAESMRMNALARQIPRISMIEAIDEQTRRVLRRYMRFISKQAGRWVGSARPRTPPPA